MPFVLFCGLILLRYNVAVATPPRLLFTVMFCGFVELLSSPRYCPPPLFESVPISAPVEVTNTRNVAELLVLVASTRRVRLPSRTPPA